MEKHRPYPAVPDKSLLEKREFHLGRTQGEEGCESSQKFDLSKAQAMVSAFAGPITPYRSILLYHGTGVGKTCAAIQVAESHVGSKKTLVISPQTIKGGLKNSMVNVRNTPIGEDGFVDARRAARQSCTGSQYIYPSRQMNRSEFRNSVIQNISARYKFLGYEQFVNLVESLLSRVRERFPGMDDERIRPELDATLAEFFSDRVVIIDEVHNVRNSVSPPSSTTNATTNATANTRSNENGKAKAGGNANGKANANGKEKEKEKEKDKDKGRARKADSDPSPLVYLRMVLRASRRVTLVLLSATPMYNRPEEIVDILNLMQVNDGAEEIPPDLFDSEGEILPARSKAIAKISSEKVSYLRGENPETFPIRIYTNESPRVAPSTLDINGDPLPASERLDTAELNLTPVSPLQMSLYPQVVDEETSLSGIKQNAKIQQFCNVTFGTRDVGETGFNDAFKISGQDAKMRVSYRKTPIFSRKNLATYSPKIAKIVESCDSSVGNVFVFSRYRWSGILPVAIALEERGYVPVSGKPILVSAKPRDRDPPMYAMITSDDNVTASGISISAIVARSSAIGSRIKVVLGTLKASEGLDFRGFREVHVMEPWYHMNTIEQVVGRVVRYCSHARFPKEERNVSVYLHCSTFGTAPKRTETRDEYNYRISQRKLLQKAKVDRVIKRNAFDCGLLRELNHFPNKGMKQLRDSKGKVVKVSVGDTDNSRACDFEKCGYPCPDLKVTKFDMSTFDPFFARHAVDMAGWDVLEILEKRRIVTFKELSDQGFDPLVLALTLEALMNPIQSRRWLRETKLVFANGFYILLSDDFDSNYFTVSELMEGRTSRNATEVRL